MYSHKVHVFIQGVSETGGRILFMCSLDQKQGGKIYILCFLGQIVFLIKKILNIREKHTLTITFTHQQTRGNGT
jgi:hypothetical protein